MNAESFFISDNDPLQPMKALVLVAERLSCLRFERPDTIIGERPAAYTRGKLKIDMLMDVVDI